VLARQFVKELEIASWNNFVKDISILVATDLAARGIDVKNLICSQLPPDVYEAYVHRSGRTAGGNKGFH
jgi:superfamily II DNA/RNA helicase